MKSSWSQRLRETVLFIAMSAIGIVFIAPLLFMFISSFKSDAVIFSNLNRWSAYLPSAGWSLRNYTAVFEKSDLPSFLLNSTLIAALVVVGGVLVNSMLAFSIARMRWRGRNLLLALVVAMVIVPFEVIAIPLLSLVARPFVKLLSFCTEATLWNVRKCFGFVADSSAVLEALAGA